MADVSKIKLPNGTTYDIKDTIHYNMTVSRGEQLVTNGSAMLGDNTNFTNWTFDGAKANSSAGSFTRVGNYANIGTDDYFPVNANEKYKFEFDLMSQNNTGTMYGMLLFYDVDKQAITASDSMFYSGTLTTLTQDLKAGDTVVHLADASNYKTYGTASHLRALTFWDYSNSFGYLYPPETYSKNHIWSAWTDDNSIDKTNNTITLATAYTGTTKPAGTYVSQGCSGGTYKYSGITGNKVPTTWTHYTGYFDGTDYSGLNKGGMFPPATAYCKVGFLWNYNSANDRFWLTNVSVKEVPKEAKYADSADTSVYSYATGDEDGTFKLYPQANNEINFGGSASKATVFFGYKAVDNQTAPTKYVFSGSTGTASLQCNKVYLGSGTTAYIDSTSYTGSAAKVNNHTVNSDVPSGAKFTDTVTTATTTGSGNAVTAVTASNGALTITKGTTFLTSHQDISGKADKSATVSTVTYDSTNKKITKTINGTTTDVVTVATLKTDLGISIPTTTGSKVTGISIGNHTTGTVIGVQSSTTTASKATAGTAVSIPNVTSAGSASNWVFENITVPVAASATACDDITSWSAGSGSASLTMAIDSSDSKKLNITFSHTHTAPTLQYTARSIAGVSGSVTASHVKSGGNGTAPTLGTAISITPYTFSDVTVPIKNTSASTFVTGTTHTITDNGHTHNLS